MTRRQKEVLAEAVEALGIGDVYTWEHLSGNVKPSKRYPWEFATWKVRFISQDGDVLTVEWDQATGRIRPTLDYAMTRR